MPELPEVETIRLELLPRLAGQAFTGVTVADARLVQGTTAGELQRRLTGRAVAGLDRRGKYLLFHLCGGDTLVVHLRMTGSLLLNPPAATPYIRATFQLADGTRLALADRRRLAVICLVSRTEDVTGKLGIEPLTPGFSAALLAHQLQRRKLPVKAFLLNQSIIAGVGNMYADEALFRARIHPQKRSSALSTGEARKLHAAIRQVLRGALQRQGASVDTYVRPGGLTGTAHLDFNVAHRGGQPCPICGAPIQRIEVAGRGSYFCPGCQKL
ncbi:MAG: bifunctional DNA-formamidopyrimidine glycosylase/DNA-(apurinic or apyrimidinic site) lyase [Chloroflexota bacterium]